MTPTTRPIAPAEVAQGMAHVSLFSGVGGFELAMQQAGIPTIAACEIDKAARGVLADHFPDTHIYHDVKGVTGDSLRSLGADPGRTVLTAGWPCQGNSVAGRRGGMDDERSGLWAEVARILAEFRPAWFIGENVPGLLSVAGGWDYATVLGDLARLGYGFAWRVLDSRRFGVPQRRRRVVLVGHLGDDGRAPAQVLLEPQGSGRNPAESITPRPIFARRTGSSAQVAGITGTTTHALTAEGHDASEDGTGRGTPIIYAAEATVALDTAQGGPDDNTAQGGHLVAYQCHGSNVGPMGTLRAGNGNEGGGVPFIYAAEVVPALLAGANDTGGTRPPGTSVETAESLVAYQKVRRSGERGPDGELPPEVWAERDVAATLSPADLTSEHRAVEFVAGTTVRRLTPLECERLQGYPDGWTLTSDGKAQADSARYKQLGNSIAVPVFTWVAKRLAAVASSCHGTGVAA